MNAFNGSANGTECWLYDATNAMMNNIASQICTNFATKGFYNRGVKYTTNYHDLNASNMPAMIVETMFCDSRKDIDLYNALGVRGIAELIANGINKRMLTMVLQLFIHHQNRVILSHQVRNRFESKPCIYICCKSWRKDLARGAKFKKIGLVLEMVHLSQILLSNVTLVL